ncbi:hypothetical protein SDC9_39895 [bioreactor metagenome]|uniref:Uncharacterized protein n=1 Tax=bioreactor metagenome TaxID=1076179 RepID=A0A644VQT5_9ZZZZ
MVTLDDKYLGCGLATKSTTLAEADWSIGPVSAEKGFALRSSFRRKLASAGYPEGAASAEQTDGLRAVSRRAEVNTPLPADFLYFLHLLQIGFTRCFVWTQFGKGLVGCGKMGKRTAFANFQFALRLGSMILACSLESARTAKLRVITM